MAVRQTISSASSFEGASHLIGELAADGTASLQRDDSTLNSNSGELGLDSQDSVASSEESIHGELDGLVPEPAANNRSAILRSNHYNKSENHHGESDFTNFETRRRKSLAVRLQKTDQAGRYQLTAEDPELRDLLKQGFERSKDGAFKKKRSRFRDLVFTRQFTAFDRQNAESASSPFHGFFSLFWSVLGDMGFCYGMG